MYLSKLNIQPPSLSANDNFQASLVTSCQNSKFRFRQFSPRFSISCFRFLFSFDFHFVFNFARHHHVLILLLILKLRQFSVLSQKFCFYFSSAWNCACAGFNRFNPDPPPPPCLHCFNVCFTAIKKMIKICTTSKNVLFILKNCVFISTFFTRFKKISSSRARM